MATKRVSLVSLAASPVESVPGASRPDLIHVAPNTVAPTPLNPRRAFDETSLAELGEDMRSGQLQPCVAVTKAAYVKLFPEHAGQLPEECRYVMAAGERRWRAAVKVGLASLDVMVRHDLTESRVRFLAAVLSENVQRANFNPIEEADGLRAMLELHEGNQAAAARAMGKSKAWFNQRIGLLRLSDEMVSLVLEGTLTAFRDMRRYAALPPEEQYAAWKADQGRPAPAAETYTAVYAEGLEPVQQAAPSASAPPEPESFTAVKPEPAPVANHPAPQPASADPVPEAPRPREAVPEPRHDDAPAPQAAAPAASAPPPRLPYDDGNFIAMHLITKMSDGELVRMLRVLNEHAASNGLEVQSAT
jgi:ParB family chromosome partitioning protein